MITNLGPLVQGSAAHPLYSFKVPAGFPSPAADHMEQRISLDELLEIRAPPIYLVRIQGDSMQGAGIFCGDLVMCIIEFMVPALEVYSIDEAFADLTGMHQDLDALGRDIREQVFRRTGIPVGVGIAGTKTLAKLANHAAKKWHKQQGGDPFARPVPARRIHRRPVCQRTTGRRRTPDAGA